MAGQQVIGTCEDGEAWRGASKTRGCSGCSCPPPTASLVPINGSLTCSPLLAERNAIASVFPLSTVEPVNAQQIDAAVAALKAGQGLPTQSEWAQGAGGRADALMYGAQASCLPAPATAAQLPVQHAHCSIPCPSQPAQRCLPRLHDPQAAATPPSPSCRLAAALTPTCCPSCRAWASSQQA